MSNYNEYIGKVREYLKERNAREIVCPSSVDELKQDMPVQVGPGSNPGIILRSDTFAELGNPSQGSTAFILWTEDTSLVRDGHVSLVGPDIPEIEEGTSQPFGQVLMLAGANLSPDLQDRIEEYQHISDNLEGYMVRSSSRNIWGRISKDAAAKGFNMETLARTLILSMKTGVPEVEAMEIVFVTASRDDIRELDEIAAKVDSLRREIIKEYWKEKGYDLECDVNCASCSSKETCDDIRDIIRAREAREKTES